MISIVPYLILFFIFLLAHINDKRISTYATFNEDIDRIISITVNTPPPLADETIQQQRLNSIKRNSAQFLLTGIVCYEELPFTSVEDALAEYDNLEIMPLGTSQTIIAIKVANCTNYPMPEPPAFYDEPVDSDIPTLILQGEFDVRTPLTLGKTLSEELSNDTLVIVPEAGHETSASVCITSIIGDFVAEPDAELDTSCVDDRREDFVLPDEDLGTAD